MARKLKTPIRVKRTRQHNQGGSLSWPQTVVTGVVGFALPFAIASGIRNSAKPKDDPTPLEHFTWGQILLQGAATWGINRLVAMTPASTEGKGVLAAGMYLSVGVAGLGLLAKDATPAVKRILGVGGMAVTDGGPSGSSPSGTTPAKLDTAADDTPKRVAKLIYDPIAGRVAGFYSDTGYIPVTDTSHGTNKDKTQIFFVVTSTKEILTRPEGRGPWLAKPQGSDIPSIDTSGVDFTENSDEVGYRVRLVAGPSTEAGYLVDITRNVKMTYRHDDDLQAIFVKEPSNGVEYIAMSQTGHPLGIDEAGKVISLPASKTPVLGGWNVASPMFAANRFLLGAYRG